MNGYILIFLRIFVEMVVIVEKISIEFSIGQIYFFPDFDYNPCHPKRNITLVNYILNFYRVGSLIKVLKSPQSTNNLIIFSLNFE